MLSSLPPLTVYESEYEAPSAENATDRSITVKNVNGTYVVEGEWLYRFMSNINFDDREALMHFEKVLRENGVIDALEKAGCGEGKTVRIYDLEFDFVE